MIEISQIINSIFSSNTYILEYKGHDYVWLIDCGDIDRIVEKGYNVKGVFLTHSHFDHIYGIPQLIERFPKCLIYTSEWGVKGLASDKLNFSRYHGTSINYVGDNIQVLHEGDRIELFNGINIEALETPGHDASCLSFKVGNNLFTGDAYIPGIKTVTTFPRSNKEQALESLIRLQELESKYGYTVCAGHPDCINDNR